MKRRDDWIKDMNFNLIKGKVVKATHYFDDELTNVEKIKLVKTNISNKQMTAFLTQVLNQGQSVSSGSERDG